MFDAERLKEIIAELGAELKPLGRDPRLKDINQTLTLVDATLIAALPKLMQASWLKQTTGSGMVKWRLHTHFGSRSLRAPTYRRHAERWRRG